MAQIPVALQLYTVRQLLAQDYAGTLRAAKDIGYDMVQLTGQVPYGADELKSLLADIGLGVAGIHVEWTQLRDNLDHWIEFAKVIGTDDLVWPYIEPQHRQTSEDWLKIIDMLNSIGERCKQAGMRLSYHNHSFEFETIDGQFILDAIYDRIPADVLYAELDTYWIQHGGADPVDYIRKYSGRMPILHLKDMADNEKRSFAEVGNGILDWPAIHAAAIEAGVEFYAVEQDTCPGDPLESARMSREYVAKLVGG